MKSRWLRRLVMNAVKNGKYEALVYSFPSALCTDSGRAITALIRNGPKPSRARQAVYQRYLEIAKPQGYKLKAMVINFPGGMPGDIGLFLNSAPERK